MKSKRRDESSKSGNKHRASARELLTSFWLPIVGGILTIAAAVAGTVHYYESQTCDLKVSKLEQTTNARISKIEQESSLHETLIKLEYERRLRSIDFGLGEHRDYFDVSKLLIPPTKIQALPPTSQRFVLMPNLTFYVEDYPGGDWTFSESNELAVTEMMVGRQRALKEARDMELVDELRRSRVFIFRPKDEIRLDMSRRLRDPDAAQELILFPIILVEPVKHSDIAAALRTDKGKRAEVAALLNTRDTTANPALKLSVDTRIEAALNDMFQSDFAAKVLNSIIDEGFKYVSDYNNVEYKVVAVQKLRNMIFLQTQLTFNEVKTTTDTRDVEVNEFVFFVTGSDRSFLIRALVPVTGAPDLKHFDWVMRWLTGVRVVWS